jgi:2-iminobutanoate/2-iminopropanoate deaminase
MKTIETPNAPRAVGPYSQAIQVDNWVYCSGQISQEGDVTHQTEQILKNLSAVLAAAGCTLNQVVKTTVYLADMNDFAAMNAAYAKVFGTHRPARACVQAARLPKEVQVEIDAVAYIESSCRT